MQSQELYWLQEVINNHNLTVLERARNACLAKPCEAQEKDHTKH